MSDSSIGADRRRGSSNQTLLVKTCENCAHAKIRCTRSEGRSSCDRCHRLRKECTFRPARTNLGRVPQERRIDALEAKVEQLLANSSAPAAGSISSNDSPDIQASSQTSENGDVIDKGFLTIEAANTLVDSFKKIMMPHFPFVIIPDGMTGEKLRYEKPFVFLTVLTAAMFDNMPVQRKLEHEAKQYISDRMIFGGKISVELLQGLLVHLAWCQYHSRPRRFSQYLQLAVSIILDLRLDRPLDQLSKKNRVWLDSQDGMTALSWGREVQRAVVGCYFISSSISRILDKSCTFPLTPYIEECGQSLATNPEYPSDTHIIFIIKLQYLLDKMDHPLRGVTETNREIERHIQNQRKGLEHYKVTVPFDLKESTFLLMQYHTTELYLTQISLFDRRRDSQPTPWSQFQLDSLCNGLLAARSLLSFYASAPLRAETGFNNAQWVQLGFGMTLASKLAVAALEPSIYHQTAEYREALDMSSVLRQVILRLQGLITPHFDARGDRDAFYHYEKRMKKVQWWYENSIAQPGYGPPADQSYSAIPPVDMQQTVPSNMQSFFYSDINDILGEWMMYPATPFPTYNSMNG
ncbi:hypothetical protein AWENTII_003091 [Aspergillus wentii]